MLALLSCNILQPSSVPTPCWSCDRQTEYVLCQTEQTYHWTETDIVYDQHITLSYKVHSSCGVCQTPSITTGDHWALQLPCNDMLHLSLPYTIGNFTVASDGLTSSFVHNIGHYISTSRLSNETKPLYFTQMSLACLSTACLIIMHNLCVYNEVATSLLSESPRSSTIFVALVCSSVPIVMVVHYTKHNVFC